MLEDWRAECAFFEKEPDEEVWAESAADYARIEEGDIKRHRNGTVCITPGSCAED